MTYNMLLQGITTDDDIKQKSIEYAEILLQDRIWCDIKLTTDKGYQPSMRAICCLPEHGQIFTNHWMGKEIDSQKFTQLVYEFSAQMRSLRMAKVEPVNSGTGKVTSVTTTFNLG